MNIINRETSKNKELSTNDNKITFFSKYANQIIIQNINNEKKDPNNNILS